EVAASRRCTAGGELRLAEADDVLGQRQAGDDRAVLAGRARQPAADRVETGETRVGGDVAGEAGERGAIGVPGRGEPAALQLDVPEQRLDVGAVLGDVAAGRDRRLDRGRGARQV